MQNQQNSNKPVSVSDYLLSRHVRHQINVNGEHLVHIQRTQRTQTGWLVTLSVCLIGQLLLLALIGMVLY